MTGPTAPPPAPRYGCAGVSFALPSEWEDATTFVARAPGADPSAPLVLKVARERMGPSDSLWTHAGQVMAKLAKEIPGYELQESGDLEVAGRPGVAFRFRFTTDAGTCDQYLVLLDPRDDPERRVVVFNMSGPEAQSAAMHEALQKILRSLDIPGRPADSPARPRPTTSAGATAMTPTPDLDYPVPMPAFRGG